MILELSGEYAPKPHYDVCVIGAGAAGITIAAKARALGLSVFLAEGGGSDYSDESQSCYRGTVVGDEYFDLESARLRYFGGTTNHWGGMCRPLETYDFEAKPVAAADAWPIGRRDLDPFAKEASEIVAIGRFPQDSALNSQGSLRRVHFKFSYPPVHFGQKFHDAFAADSGIEVCLNCNAVDVRFDGRMIHGARFRNFGDKEIEVRARTYVLACGGIENSRLLLHWNALHRDALGNQGGNVGRYWMEHPTETIGQLLTCGNIALPGDDADLPISRQRLYVVPSRAFMEKQKILNCVLHIYRESHGPLDAVVSEGVCHGPAWLSRAILEGRFGTLTTWWVRASSEQQPTWENHISLGASKDRLGIPLSVLHWRRSALDKKTVRAVAVEAGATFAHGNWGRLKLHDWLLSEDSHFSCEGGGFCPGGFHHMGGTRMATSSASGVVDANSRVFGVENLFVAGSSVFPSTGCYNPTFSIVQLSLRLATHLGSLLADPIRSSPSADRH